MKRYVIIIVIFLMLGTIRGHAQSAADCMQALRRGDNLGYLSSHNKSHVSTVVVALPINTTSGLHTNVGWLYVDQFGLEWVQLNGNATASMRRSYKINERPGVSGIYPTRSPVVPSGLSVESCR